MPFATFTKIREVSSEDNIHLAENLIKSQPGKKWKTKTAGEKSAYVILEMSDSYKITGIDIGNEHSSFVEVLVGKSSCAPEEFTEILITCSFMTPTESKNSSNINRVRCFNREALVPTAAERKWSMVKVLCTQPFNKHVSYGLSFIKIHINDNAKSSSTTQNSLITEKVLNKTTELQGKLKFREDSPDSEAENSLFSRWKKSKDNSEEQTTAASIRIAPKNPASLETRRFNNDDRPKTLTPTTNDKYLDRNRENLLFGEETDDSNNKSQEKLKRLSEQIETDKKRRRLEKEKETETNKKARKSLDCSPKIAFELQTKPTNPKINESKIRKNISINKQPSSPQENRTKNISSKKVKPFNQLLKDVVLVISGIQNPDRGDLRNKAVALGAKYKSDWDSSCTHLICAFKNTPKYNQVKGKGKIITRSWVEKCYSLKKYLPWRRYALDSKELTQPESDEEIICDTQISQDKGTAHLSDLKTTNTRESEEKTNTSGSYDIDENSNGNNIKCDLFSSESDTDDEIKRVEKNLVRHDAKATQMDIYEVSTDEEDYISEKLSKNE